jgi:hypothetical protein
MTDPLSRLVPALTELPEALADLPLHEAIIPAAFGLPDPPCIGPRTIPGEAQRATIPVHPDFFSLDVAEPLNGLLDSVAGALQVRGRPPLGLLLTVALLAQSLPLGLSAVTVGTAAGDALSHLITGLFATRALTRVILGEPPTAPADPAPHPDLHTTILAAPRFTFADLRPARVGLVYLQGLELSDAHWNWFHVERLIETLDTSLAPGAAVVIAAADRGNVQRGIVESFIPLHADRYEIVHQGRFGASARQTRPFLVLRKLRDHPPEISAALRAATQALFAGTVRLTHEQDRELPARPRSALQLVSTMDRRAGYVIAPQRNVTIESLADDRFSYRFPAYFATEYEAPEIRLTRLQDGIVFSRLPTCVATGDGSVFATSYILEEYLGRSPERYEDRRQILARRGSGQPYIAAFGLHPAVLRDGIPELTNYLDQPVYFLGIRWMEMFGHFLHELCPQVTLWRQYLQPRGVKLLLHPLSRPWQWEALRSIGVQDRDCVIYPPNSAIMCRELWFSHSFEDARYSVLPEIVDFADRTALSDKSRKRTLRVYAARTDTQKRRLINEPELIERLRREGFTIFVGAEHSLAEQIRMFEEADLIVGKDGTNLTNIIFGDESTMLVEILGEAFFDPLYLRIANARRMHYDHVLAQAVSTPGASGRDLASVVDIDDVLITIDRALRRRQRTQATSR